MAQTTVNEVQNSAVRNKLIGRALFTETTSRPTTLNNLTGEAPKTAENKFVQTSHKAPVVRVTDLQREAGDEVSMDIVYQLRGGVTMGDKVLKGKEEGLQFGSFSCKINQGRKAVSAGGKMSQKRSNHDLLSTAKTLLDTWYLRYQDQLALYHLAGARGDFVDRHTLVPLASDPSFAEQMVNPILPPTYDCHLFGGDGSCRSIADIEATDKLTMETIDNLYLYLKEKQLIEPCSLRGDQSEGNPMFVAYCSERQLRDLKASLDAKNWNELIANAINRSKGWDHPLFKGNDTIMYNNILFKSYGNLPIRFNAGSVIKETTDSNNATVTDVTVPDLGADMAVDRMIVLGSQALVNAYGSGYNGTPFGMITEKDDYDNQTNIALSWINGMKKIQMADSNGRLNDFGVIAIDTAVSLK